MSILKLTLSVGARLAREGGTTDARKCVGCVGLFPGKPRSDIYPRTVQSGGA